MDKRIMKRIDACNKSYYDGFMWAMKMVEGGAKLKDLKKESWSFKPKKEV